MHTIIYILDDEPQVLDILKQSLEVLLRNVQIKIFELPEDLFRDPELETVDLFIIDISLTSKRGAYDGRYVPEELPDKCKMASFLFISGIVSDLDFALMPTGIVYDFMPKPWNVYIFQNRVRNLLRLTSERKDFFARIGVDETRAYFRKQIADDRAVIKILRAMPQEVIE